MFGTDQTKEIDQNAIKVKDLEFTDLMPVTLPQDSLAGDVIENIVQDIPYNFLDTTKVTTPDIRFLDERPRLVHSSGNSQNLLSPEDTTDYQLSESSSTVDMEELATLASDQVHSSSSEVPVLTLNEEQCLNLFSSNQRIDLVTCGPRDTLKYEPPSPATSDALSPSPVPYREMASNAGPIKSKGRRKVVEKDSEEYRLRRERNNIAVRKSRNKAKQRQEQIDQKNSVLETENRDLRQRLESMQQELKLLKEMFESANLPLPEKFSKYS